METSLSHIKSRTMQNIRNSIIAKSLTLFDLGDLRKLILTTLVTIFLAVLDLLGVLLVGVVTSIAFNGFTSSAQGKTAGTIVNVLGLGNSNFEVQISTLAIVVVFLFVTKSLVSLFLNRKLLFFLSNRSARLSESLINDYFGMPLEKLEGRPIQSTIYTLTSAPGFINLGIVGGYIQITGDFFLLFLMLIGLLFVDIATTIGLVALYVILVLMLVLVTHKRVAQLGSEIATLTIESREGINEISGTFRELSVKGERSYYANRVGKLQYQVAFREAELKFLSNISKYIFEITMVTSISLMVVYQLLTQTASRTVTIAAIFVTASVRIMPAMLRLQQNMLGVRKSFTMSKLAFELIEEIENSKNELEAEQNSNVEEFMPSILLDGVTFRYGDSNKLVFHKLSLEVHSGEFVGIMGKSGVGKSTLVDLILGFLKPNEGRIDISGVGPLQAVKNWPGAIGYLPQKTFLMSGTVRKNLALGLQEDRYSDQDYLVALEAVDLTDGFDNSKEILNFVLDEDATNISGGQRQRIGLARAILGRPKILVLDESTSSLDKETEQRVLLELRRMLPNSTVLLISHRESALAICDRVYVLSTTGSGATINEKFSNIN